MATIRNYPYSLINPTKYTVIVSSLIILAGKVSKVALPIPLIFILGTAIDLAFTLRAIIGNKKDDKRLYETFKEIYGEKAHDREFLASRAERFCGVPGYPELVSIPPKD